MRRNKLRMSKFHKIKELLTLLTPESQRKREGAGEISNGRTQQLSNWSTKWSLLIKGGGTSQLLEMRSTTVS